jgi:hypothetical protein
VFRNGDEYVGEFVDGKLEGKGRYVFKSGGEYEGEFVGDRFHGRGKETYADGSEYKGMFDSGDKHGEGTMTYYRSVEHRSKGGRYKSAAEGLLFEEIGHYVGSWSRGKKHGAGKWSSMKNDWLVEDVRFEEGKRVI